MNNLNLIPEGSEDYNAFGLRVKECQKKILFECLPLHIPAWIVDA
jgi:hypothetical protein